MIPLTDERLRQLAYDEYVCINETGRAMAVELLAARGRITKLTGERDELRDSVRGYEAIRQHQADRIAALGRLARTLWDRRRQWQTDAIEVVTAHARVTELEAAQRPPLGYVVGFVTSAHGLTFARDYGGPDPTRAGAEQELAHEAEENPGVEFKLLELREARPCP